ncbi:phospholipase A [Psychrobacter sp. Ps3]|uniref:phospholipase A n=1 Tax=Psychrobacter sp. Ps3 TaxID=2790957 RepID=UPI001EDFDC21|nr:phospholipase A [Psychrobacter sp. Ps3]MCG3880926.1 phospholipase A [Psychrobacter sp. Ps3]
MFAQVITRYQAQLQPTFNTALKTPLNVAIGVALSCTALQAQAASEASVYNEIPVAGANVEYLGDDAIEPSQMPSDAFIAQQAQLFLECTEVQTSAARLACFDKVAEQGKTPSYTMSKQPVDLAKTFKTTISGNPQVILAQDDLDEADDTLDTEQEQTNTSLSAVGLTKREAKVLEEVGVTQEQIERYSPLSLAYDLDQNSERGTWTVRPYRPTYVLPLFYTFDPNLSPTPSNPDEPGETFTSNDVRNTELKFQLSLKTKVGEDLFDTSADLWFGYTQESHWQVYNEDNSRPFRATDYQPEIFLTQPVAADLPFGGRLRMLGAGAIHHSNGQDDPLSRSWNRAYLLAGAEWGKLSVVPRLWARINNEDESSEDNPDIEDYMGYGDIKFLYDLPDQQSLSGTLRYNPSTNKGAAQIDYIYPLSENVNGYVQLFQGYGESIIDYNHENTAIGFGIVLNDWKGF